MAKKETSSENVGNLLAMQAAERLSNPATLRSGNKDTVEHVITDRVVNAIRGNQKLDNIIQDLETLAGDKAKAIKPAMETLKAGINGLKKSAPNQDVQDAQILRGLGGIQNAISQGLDDAIKLAPKIPYQPQEGRKASVAFQKVSDISLARVPGASGSHGRTV